ncbi:hypothetical protein [Campylobacter rectus]
MREPGLALRARLGIKKRAKGGRNPTQGLRGEINLGDNAMLSEKDVASAKNYLQACAYGLVTAKRRKR